MNRRFPEWDLVFGEPFARCRPVSLQLLIWTIAYFQFCTFSFVAKAFAEPLKVGAIFSLSGFGAEGGLSELQGLTLAMERINSNGGIGGRALELLVEDNQSSLVGTATAFRRIASNRHVPIVLGPNWTEFFEVAASLAKSEQLVVLTSSGNKESIFTENGWAFSLWPSHARSTKPLADCLIRREIKSLSVLLTENAYFEEVFSALEKQVVAGGLRIDGVHRYAPGTTDFRSSISRLKRTNPSGVLALLKEGGDLITFCRQAKQQELALPVFTANVPPYDELLKMQPSTCEGLVFFDFRVPGGEKFLADYRARFKQEAGVTSSRAYDSLYLVKDCVERIGNGRQEIQKCMKELSFSGISGPIAFDSKGVIAGTETLSHVVQIENGRFVETECPKPTPGVLTR